MCQEIQIEFFLDLADKGGPVTKALLKNGKASGPKDIYSEVKKCLLQTFRE